MAGDHNKRVLIVDDDPDVRQLLGNVLRQRSLIVDEADDGTTAIERLRTHRYAVVLLDLLMPGADAFAVLEALRSETLHSPRPVVLVLTAADRRTTERLDAQLIHGIVRKPFDPSELASIVVACSEIKSRRSLEAMALAMISGAPLLDLLRPFGG